MTNTCTICHGRKVLPDENNELVECQCALLERAQNYLGEFFKGGYSEAVSEGQFNKSILIIDKVVREKVITLVRSLLINTGLNRRWKYLRGFDLMQSYLNPPKNPDHASVALSSALNPVKNHSS